MRNQLQDRNDNYQGRNRKQGQRYGGGQERNQQDYGQGEQGNDNWSPQGRDEEGRFTGGSQSHQYGRGNQDDDRNYVGGFSGGQGMPGRGGHGGPSGYGMERQYRGSGHNPDRSQSTGGSSYRNSDEFSQRGIRERQDDDMDDYSHWRNEQMSRLDEDYNTWRGERRKKFADEFDTWRKERSASQDGHKSVENKK